MDALHAAAMVGVKDGIELRERDGLHGVAARNHYSERGRMMRAAYAARGNGNPYGIMAFALLVTIDFDGKRRAVHDGEIGCAGVKASDAGFIAHLRVVECDLRMGLAVTVFPRDDEVAHIVVVTMICQASMIIGAMMLCVIMRRMPPNADDLALSIYACGE
jgi:hypothetical protein